MTRFILVSFAFLAWCFWELSGGADYAPRTVAEPIFAPAVPLEERRRMAEAERAAAARVDLTSAAARDTAAQPATQSQVNLRTQTDLIVQAALDSDPLLEEEAGAAAEEDRISVVLQGQPILGISSEGLTARSFDTTSLSVEGLRDRSGTVGVLTGQRIGIATFDTSEPVPEPVPDIPALDIPAPQIDAPRADLREVTGDQVNMRAGPGTSYGVLDQLPRGEAVEVLASAGDGWLELRVLRTGEIGYIADWLVTAAAE